MSVYIVRRETRTRGVRWHVRYEAGRNAKIVHLGAFGTLREAEWRKQAALDVLAKGGTPTRAQAPDEDAQRTLAEFVEPWLASRVDVAPGTLRNFRIALRDLPDRLAGKQP